MRKKSKHKPKPIDRDPLGKLQPADEKEGKMLMARIDSALMSVLQGTVSTEDDWRILSDAINTVMELSLGDNPKLPKQVMLPIIKKAIEGMIEAGRRFKDGKAIRLNALHIDSIKDVVAIYEECVKNLTRKEMIAAQELVQARAIREMNRPNGNVFSI